VDAEGVLLLQLEDAIEGIDRADRSCAERCDDRADVLGGESLLEGGHVHASGVVGADGYEGQAEDAGDAGVGVVGLVGCGDGALRLQLARDPQGFEVGKGATT
jgi:hypothetical protein